MSSPTVHETTSPPPQRRGHRRAGHRASHVLEGLHEQAGSLRAAVGAPALARRARRQPRARTGRRWRDRRNTNVPACDAAPARGVRVRACSPLVQPTRWGDTRARAAIQKSVRFPPSRAPTSSPSVAAPTPGGGGRRARSVDKAHGLQKTSLTRILRKNQPASGKHMGFLGPDNQGRHITWQWTPHLSTNYYFTLKKRKNNPTETIQAPIVCKKHRRTHTSRYSPNQSPN